MLNIQSDGQERLASGVRKLTHADGSSTYYIDLPAALADSPLYLSFDLLGFGNTGSQVALRDVRLLDEPVANDDRVSLDEDVAAAGNLLANDITVGAAVDRVELVAGPTHGTITLAADGSFSYQPVANYFGPDSFSYRFVDAQSRVSNTATVQLQVRPVNDAPTLPADASVTLTAGQPHTFDPLAGAVDAEGATLTLQVLSAPQHGSLVFNADGSVAYTADVTYAGEDTFIYAVTDGELASEPATLRFIVQPANTAPVARDTVLALQEDGSVLITPAMLGIDAEGDALTAAITVEPAHGTLQVQADGNWLYTPAPDFNGTDTLRFTLSDGSLSSGEATLTLHVAAVNDAPLVPADRTLSVPEDGSLAIDLLQGSSDVDGDTLSVRIVSGPDHGTLSVEPDGTYRYRPDADYHGSDSFGYVVNDGSADSGVATVAIDVTPVNDAPVLAGATLSIDEDSQVTLHPLAGAFDADGDVLIAAIISGPAHGTLAVNADGSYTYTPEPDFHGSDSFRWSVSDGHGGSVEVLATIAIAPVNDAPTAAGNVVAGSEDAALALQWGDFAAADTEGSALTLTITSVPVDGVLKHLGDDGQWHAVATGAQFTQAQLEAGTLRFVPAPDASGGPGYQHAGFGNRRSHYAQFGYTVSDGELTSAEATMVLDITALADTPLLAVGNSQGSEDNGIALQGLSAALSDSDGSERLILAVTGMPIGTVLGDGTRSFTVTEAERVANVTGWNLSTLRLTPPADFAGTIGVQIIATAIETATGSRATAVQHLQLQVQAVADAPLLTLSARQQSVSREVVNTSWESVRNTGNRATIVNAAVLEGWSIVTDGPPKQFEIWTSGDEMRNANNQWTTVQAAPGNGQNFLHLNRAAGNGHQSVGIERDIATVAGATYTLNLDYAGALGLAAQHTHISIYLDGVLLTSYAGTSSLTTLNWQALTYQFSGTGASRKLRIQLDGGDDTANGRGAVIDDIRIVETLPSGNGTVYGLVDTAIALPRIDARLTDTDGSETLTVSLLGIPAGAVISDGSRSVTLSQADAMLDITGWDLNNLSFRAPQDFTGTVTLQVRATSTEASNGATASVTQQIKVQVLSGSTTVTTSGSNPYLTLLTPQSTSATTGTAGPAQIIVSSPIVSASGSFQFTATAATLPRTWEEEEAAEQAQAGALSEDWLRELEAAARMHWEQLMGEQ